jgi:hypothetical protein
MPPRFLMCPQCGAISFYVRDSSATLRFFKVHPDKTLAHSVPPPEPPDTSDINCASCSWHGPITKLKSVFFG